MIFFIRETGSLVALSGGGTLVRLNGIQFAFPNGYRLALSSSMADPGLVYKNHVDHVCFRKLFKKDD